MLIDELYEAVQNKGNVCVGLDTSYDYIPKWFAEKFESRGDAIYEFNRKIIDAVYDSAACFKVQIAYYEAEGIDGLKAYKKTLKYIKERKCIAISDIKRGDIADTARMYAKAHFEGEFETDFVTLNPYMGMDSIEPYEKYFESGKKGAFILIRTSNKGYSDFQGIEDNSGNPLYKNVADKVYELSLKYQGKCGYGCVGGVVGCTHREESKKIRENYSKMFFLIPGYGAQGGSGEDAAAYLKDGNGGVVNSSRGILLAYKKYENGEKTFDECSRNEVLKMKGDIENAVRICSKCDKKK